MEDIEASLTVGMEKVRRLLESAIPMAAGCGRSS
jgi:hypothetical protein